MSEKYQYTEDMAELSGFGGGYEENCRKMVVAGLEWLDANPKADPQFHSYKNIYGIISEDNDDGKNCPRLSWRQRVVTALARCTKPQSRTYCGYGKTVGRNTRSNHESARWLKCPNDKAHL